MSRPAYPLMPPHSESTSDPEGKVVWWSRLGGMQAEVHHVGPYRGRLRIWQDERTAAPGFDRPVPLPGDNRRPPTQTQLRTWSSHLCEMAAAGKDASSPPPREEGGGGAATEVECRFLDDLDVADRLLAQGEGLGGTQAFDAAYLSRVDAIAEGLRVRLAPR